MKCQFVDAEKANWSVVKICKMLQFSPKAYYAWRTRGKCERELADEQLFIQIRAAFKASQETYGSPRVHAALKAAGVSVGLNRVSRLMRENGLCAQ